jgi:MFS family permease
LLAFRAHVPAWGLRWGLLGCWAMFQGAIGLVTPVWLGWVAHLFGQRTRGLVMGISFGVSASAGALGALAAAWIIGNPVAPGGFPLLYLTALALGYLSISTFWFMRDPADHQWTDPPAPGPAEVASHFLTSLRDRNFRAALIGRALAGAGVCVAPLVTSHYISPEGGGLTEQSVVRLGWLLLLMMAVGTLGLGLHGDQRGHRAGLIVGAGLQCVAPILLLTTHGWASCAAVFALAGLAQSAGFMSNLNIVLETCPHENRAAHITVANLVVAPMAILMPLAAGAVVQYWGIAPMCFVWLALSAAAAIWYLTQLRDPRHLKPAAELRREADAGRR